MIVSTTTPILGYTIQQGSVSKNAEKDEQRSADQFDPRRILSALSYGMVSVILILLYSVYSVRQGLELVQSEWNILKMGNPKYIGQCKMVRFKTIYIESVDTGASIPLMTDGVINVSLFVIFSYLY